MQGLAAALGLPGVMDRRQSRSNSSTRPPTWCPPAFLHPAIRLKPGACLQVIGASVDSAFSHLAWIQTPRKQGGLGGLTYPLLSGARGCRWDVVAGCRGNAWG